MRHYEVIFLVHPDHSMQVPEIIKQYKSIIESSSGKVHRLENWGLRKLAYPINKLEDAHYVLMNIECTQEARKEITDSFHFSDAILRNLVLNREDPVIQHSPIMKAIEKAKEDEKARKLKYKREETPPANADMEKTSSLKANEKDSEDASKKVQESEKDTAKTTESTMKSDESKNRESDNDRSLVKNDTEDTPEKEGPVDSTKK